MPVKLKTPRNSKYLQYIRGHPCFRCGQSPAPGVIEAAHVRMGAGAGMGQKPSDYYTVPLCGRCHDFQHTVGERTFWSDIGRDPWICISGFLVGYLSSARAGVQLLEGYVEYERGKPDRLQGMLTCQV